MKDNILLYFLFFTVFLTLSFFIYILLLRNRFRRKNVNEALISGQRERIESSVYELNELLLSNYNRLFDNTRLLLQNPQKELTTSNKVPNYSFFESLGINVSEVTVEKQTIFCIMPFHKRFIKIYDLINEACTNEGYVCHRSDTPYNPGNVLKQIVDLLLKSQLIVAVLDGKNPNVFYEIGIAHSLGKMVILIVRADKIDEIPFDLRSERLLLYSNPGELKNKLSTILKNIHYVG